MLLSWRCCCHSVDAAPCCHRSVCLSHRQTSSRLAQLVTHPLWNSSTLKPTVGATSTTCLLLGCMQHQTHAPAVCQQTSRATADFALAQQHVLTLRRSMAVVLPLLSRPTTSTLTWHAQKNSATSVAACCLPHGPSPAAAMAWRGRPSDHSAPKSRAASERNPWVSSWGVTGASSSGSVHCEGLLRPVC